MSDENVELIRRIYARWERGDFAKEFFDPRVEYVRVGAEGVGGSGEWHGVDEMWRASGEWFQSFEDIKIESERFVDLGARVLVISRVTGRGRRSGLDVEYEIGHVFTIGNGEDPALGVLPRSRRGSQSHGRFGRSLCRDLSCPSVAVR